ncbi:MAG TPA: ribosome silencing factor [Gammaproteobacteria bacterium]
MNTEQIKEIVVHALEDLKGKDIHVINVHGKTSVTDMLVIASGTSTRQVRSLAENVVVKAKEQGLKPIGVEGDDSGWVLVDLGEVVVHVMTPEMRDYYNLERLWGEDTPSGSLH